MIGGFSFRNIFLVTQLFGIRCSWEIKRFIISSKLVCLILSLALTGAAMLECTPRQELEDRELAESEGDAHAMTRLAVCLLHNMQHDEAVMYLRRATDAGDAEGMNNLGVCYAHGKGVTRNERKALELYEKAADLGSRDAMFNLGSMYDNGRGVDTDAQKAADWFEIAASRGQMDAVEAFSLMQVSGRGGRLRDIKAAAEGFTKLINNKKSGPYPNALFMLGLMKLKGEGQTQDIESAIKLLEDAAKLGHQPAEQHLAHLEMQLQQSAE